MSEATPANLVTFRLAAPEDRDEVAQMLARSRANISGSRRQVVFRAIVADTRLTAGRPRTIVAVAEEQGRPVGAALVTVGDHHSYWQSFSRRHPVAGAALVAHRLRMLPRRIRRRPATRPPQPGTGPHPRVDPSLAEDPRLAQPPIPEGEAGPRPTDRGPHIAFLLFIALEPAARGRGLARPLLLEAIRGARAVGLDRMDASFSPANPAAARLYLSLPFAIHRYPAGYYASVNLDAAMDR